jgi:hypothetical protein
LAFTESSLFIRPHLSDDAASSDESEAYDGALHVEPSEGFWVQPSENLRGGFRYLTIAIESDDGSVQISNVSVHINFDENAEDLREYGGYFFTKDSAFESDEDFLTKREKCVRHMLVCTEQSSSLVRWCIHGPNQHYKCKYWSKSCPARK